MFGDEASFWLDGTLHRTWARVGEQPRVPTFGMRKTAHVFGAVSLEEKPKFVHQFAPRFCGATFLDFLKLLLGRLRRKIFLIIDNGPCHNLDEEGRARSWLVVRSRLPASVYEAVIVVGLTPCWGQRPARPRPSSSHVIRK